MIRSKTIRSLALLAAGLTLLLAEPLTSSLLLRVPWRINTSPSIPPGIYRRVDEPVQQDDLVAACLPPALAYLALSRGYLGAGSCPSGAQPVLKKVLALPGDRFEFTAYGFLRDGKLLPTTASMPRDRRGRPVPHISFGIYTVRPGEIWLYGELPNSWDSRYWGSLPISSVRETLRPAWTAR